VDAHQGRLEIGTSELGGACFRIRLKNQVPDENVLVRDEAPE
jgi:signal transduction histidine kinase